MWRRAEGLAGGDSANGGEWAQGRVESYNGLEIQLDSKPLRACVPSQHRRHEFFQTVVWKVPCTPGSCVKYRASPSIPDPLIKRSHSYFSGTVYPFRSESPVVTCAFSRTSSGRPASLVASERARGGTVSTGVEVPRAKTDVITSPD